MFAETDLQVGMVVEAINGNTKFSTSKEARFRVQGYVIIIEENVKKQIRTILKILDEIKPKQDLLKKEETNSYIIAWETNLPRTPIKQVLPKLANPVKPFISIKLYIIFFLN